MSQFGGDAECSLRQSDLETLVEFDLYGKIYRHTRMNVRFIEHQLGIANQMKSTEGLPLHIFHDNKHRLFACCLQRQQCHAEHSVSKQYAMPVALNLHATKCANDTN